MPEKKKPDLTFEKMYGRLEEVGVPEKVFGKPVCRADNEHLEELKREQS